MVNLNVKLGMNLGSRVAGGLATVLLVVAGTLGSALAADTDGAPAPDPALLAVIAGDHRSAENRARDVHRHPTETLSFFGLTPDSTVVEIWPATGWYTEILAPYLRDRGTYYAAGWDPEADAEFIRQGVQRFKDKLAARPELYGKVRYSVLSFPDKTEIAPPGSADLVLTFRNIHNWMPAGNAEAAFAAMYKALKPGGVLGVVEHRAPTDQPQDPKARSGYVREDYAIALAEKAGFVLEAKSEINANPRDTKDHPKGVWTLPPTFAEKDADREKYQAIGESDRFTLKFRKPR
jgi:predicted methyltransferase